MHYRCFQAARLATVVLTFIVVRPAHSEEQPPPMSAQARFFEAKIRPLLAQRCFDCHGRETQESGLRLDSLAAMLEGGDSGPAIVRGSSKESLLVEAINYASLQMPPDEKLNDDQIAALTAWIETGASWPEAGGDPQAKVRRSEKFTAEDRAWWAFQPVDDPPLPAVDDGGWCRTDLDRFIFRRLQENGITPAPEAEARALLRRVYFDLTGLPPAPEEVDRYLADPSANRYERLVDRLLESPRYGERWARHWLDLVRYAESDGWRQDAFRPNAHAYRDYVVTAFNADKPYDRFVTEQLAGDEVAPGDADAITATGYLRHGTYEYNQRDVATQWTSIVDEITDNVGDVFLGMAVTCAKCHDHKFDPILQEDYYRLRAFFTPLLWREEQPVATVDERARHAKQLAAWEAKTAEPRAELAQIEWPVLLKHAGGQGFSKFPPEIRAMVLKQPEDRLPLEQQLAHLALRQLELKPDKLPEQLDEEEKRKWQRLREQLAEFDSEKPKPLPTRPFAVSDVGPEAPPNRIPGDRRQREIAPGRLSLLEPEPARIEPPNAALKSTGRRSALASWITDPENPLSTRVIVNRIWQYHFGRGLVSTSNDFGRLGERPSHPELLDWLTRRFLEQGWRLKPLHRLILTSAVYRQSALHIAPAAQAADPDNRLLWRMTSRRLDAEPIRDAMLAVSGEIDYTMGGASVETSAPRRSIYTRLRRNQPDPLLGILDAPDGMTGVAVRDVTTTPLQALELINGEWTLKRARALAARLEREKSTAAERVERAYQLAYARLATPQQRTAALALLDSQAAKIGGKEKSAEAETEALVDFCHVLLNSNEFLYVD
ncbi:MAG: DUF1553 domain-containing protein [Rhodopirellula sp.]|nr:DUF1553 domain-containing protein [Rhodopirellula sp.]